MELRKPVMRSDPSKSYIVSEHCPYSSTCTRLSTHTGNLVCLTGILLDLGKFCNVYNEKTWKKKRKKKKKQSEEGSPKQIVKRKNSEPLESKNLKAKLDKGTPEHQDDRCTYLREHTRTEGPKDGQI